MTFSNHSRISLTESIELIMDAAAVQGKLLGGYSRRASRDASCEFATMDLAGRKVGYMSSFCKTKASFCQGNSPQPSRGPEDFSKFATKHFRDELCDIVSHDKNIMMGSFPAEALRTTYSSLLEKWTLATGGCGDILCKSCASSALLAVGSHIFFANYGNMRAFRSSRRMKKINVTHDLPAVEDDGPQVIDFFVEPAFEESSPDGNGFSFMVIVSEAIWSCMTNMEAFDVVRSCLKSDKNKSAKKAAQALLDYAKGCAKDEADDSEALVIVIVWSNPEPAI